MNKYCIHIMLNTYILLNSNINFICSKCKGILKNVIDIGEIRVKVDYIQC